MGRVYDTQQEASGPLPSVAAAAAAAGPVGPAVGLGSALVEVLEGMTLAKALHMPAVQMAPPPPAAAPAAPSRAPALMGKALSLHSCCLCLCPLCKRPCWHSQGLLKALKGGSHVQGKVIPGARLPTVAARVLTAHSWTCVAGRQEGMF